MPKTNRRPHEIKTEDVVISKGVATGYEAQVGAELEGVVRADTLEEAEKAVRDQIAKQYPKGEEPQIFLIDSGGMWVVAKEE